MMERDLLQKRADDLGLWLSENAPYIPGDQKHLDESSPERAYWHHGYRAALLDVLTRCDGRDVSELATVAIGILQKIEAAEKLHPAGSHEHGMLLRAALETQWPLIHAILILTAQANARPS